MMRITSTLVFVSAFCMLTWTAHAQPADKSTIRLGLSYHQVNEYLPVLKVSAKTKKGKKFEAVEGVEINLFFMEETAQGFAGRVTTNSKGEASMALPTKFKARWDSLSSFLFMATSTSASNFADTSTEIEIQKGKIELALSEQDSARSISAILFIRQDSSWVPVQETDARLVVVRLLSDLPVGEEFYTTDKSGEVSAEYDLTLPGNEKGMVTIGAKIEDHELLGSLTVTKTALWGVPLKSDNSFERRTLFATRDKTPMWLLIFPNLAIAGVWGVIFYLIYNLIQIRRLGKKDYPV